MPRTPLIVGNWKMHKTIQETVDFSLRLKDEFAKEKDPRVEVAVAPPFTSLAAAAKVLRGSPISLSAQDVFWAESGAYTGEISPKMLADVGCRLAIVGHSERRQYFHETDDSVNRKAAALIKEGLIPIICMGETLSERQGRSTLSVVEKQTRDGLKGLADKDPENLVIAYEPVWAIGTGHTATPQQAQEVQAFIRQLLGEIFSSRIAQGMRILYGGSVKPENIADLMAMEDIDGALVGGASLDVQSFAQIIKGAQPSKR
ncbi:MAG: triose-phosphate isomerase [Deltaproteobacteria bacterium]|nr:triose-phosphate isomerase [Deltaproteobacteria bacterium]